MPIRIDNRKWCSRKGVLGGLWEVSLPEASRDCDLIIGQAFLLYPPGIQQLRSTGSSRYCSSIRKRRLPGNSKTCFIMKYIQREIKADFRPRMGYHKGHESIKVATPKGHESIKVAPLLRTTTPPSTQHPAHTYGGVPVTCDLSTKKSEIETSLTRVLRVHRSGVHSNTVVETALVWP